MPTTEEHWTQVATAFGKQLDCTPGAHGMAVAGVYRANGSLGVRG